MGDYGMPGGFGNNDENVSSNNNLSKNKTYIVCICIAITQKVTKTHSQTRCQNLTDLLKAVFPVQNTQLIRY